MTSPREAGGSLAGDKPPVADTAETSHSHSRIRTRLARDPLFWVGVSLTVAVLATAVLAPVLAPHDPEEQFRRLIPSGRLSAPPSEMFLLGTDQLGRDYLSRLIWAGRATLMVGIAANVAAVSLGLVVGLVAGFAGAPRIGLRAGRSVALPVESGLMRLTDFGLALPALLLAIAMTSVLGQSLEIVTIVIASVLWTTTARVVYGRVLVLRSREFVLAGRALGSSSLVIMRRHLLPHLAPLVLVYGSLGIATTILFEASLSYLGAGAPTDAPTWGAMLVRQTTSITSDPRLPLLPAAAIFVTVLGFTLLGDALRDALDPRGLRAG